MGVKPARGIGASQTAARSADAQPEAEPAPAPSVPTTQELVADAAKVQASLARAVELANLRRDPIGHVLMGLSDRVGFDLKIIRRQEAAVGEVIAASKPLSPEERAALLLDVRVAADGGSREGANAGMRAEARRMIRTLDRGLAARIGLGIGGAYVAGALTVLGVLATVQLGPFSREAEAGTAWRELVQDNPDPRPALSAGEVRTDPATGRRYYAGVSLWRDPSRPPPTATEKP